MCGEASFHSLRSTVFEVDIGPVLGTPACGFVRFVLGVPPFRRSFVCGSRSVRMGSNRRGAKGPVHRSSGRFIRVCPFPTHLDGTGHRKGSPRGGRTDASRRLGRWHERQRRFDPATLWHGPRPGVVRRTTDEAPRACVGGTWVT